SQGVARLAGLDRGRRARDGGRGGQEREDRARRRGAGAVARGEGRGGACGPEGDGRERREGRRRGGRRRRAAVAERLQGADREGRGEAGDPDRRHGQVEVEMANEETKPFDLAQGKPCLELRCKQMFYKDVSAPPTEHERAVAAA